jgi:hypothetical protein
MKIEPFLDRNIIKEKSLNIKFEINKPKFEKIVLVLDKDHEKTNAYYTILYLNNEYKLYYRGCNFAYYKDKERKIFYSQTDINNYQYLCLATSSDGLNFEKKNYNIIEYNKSKDNNILKHDLFCHNFSPYYDKKNAKYLAVSGTGIEAGGLHLFESIDGINWIHIKKILDETFLIAGYYHPNHFDSHNCITYNEKEDYYYIYVRDNKPFQRYVQYTKTKDFIEFTKCKNINVIDGNNLILYTPGIFKYENSDYFFCIPTKQNNNNNEEAKNNSILMISSDCINFKILTNELFDYNNIGFDNSSTLFTMNINSIVKSIDNSKMYIYTHNYLAEKSFIACHSFENNRINKIICNDCGFIKTQLIKLSKKMTVNYETFKDGYISIKLFNINNEIIYTTKEYNGSNYELEIKFDNEIIKDDNYYIKFDMYNCILYSFSYN